MKGRAGQGNISRSAWRTEIEIRISELRNRLEVTKSCEPARFARDRRTRRETTLVVERCLDRAEKAIDQRSSPWGTLRDWWIGTTVTTAWELVHEGELNLMQIEPDADVRANLPRLRTWVQQAMEDTKKRQRYSDELKNQAYGRAAVDWVAIDQAFKEVVVANRERYANLRSFRNRLVWVSAALAGIVVLASIWHLANPDFISLCTGEDTARDCIKESDPRGIDVVIVAILGALGGLLAIAFGLSETRIAPSRYDPRIWQALLKPVAGAATAIAGVLLIQAGIVVGPVGSPSESLYLGYAVVFGFSQQLFTQFVDKRAGALIAVDD
jgi:hypothetical protein